MSQPLPPHLQHGHSQFSQNPHSTAASATTTTIVTPPSITKPSSSRPPYGSGDSDDGYTLVFPSLDAFQEWRAREEEAQMVEFVKGDTHGSKAIPPRFKDHTKLVCARHSRSGRKKYVKKHPERVRKVPSRKLEGQGCQASISYKTYYDTEEVRVCYISEHSHPIGLANLPFTRRGRRAAVEADKAKNKRHSQVPPSSASDPSPSTNPVATPAVPAPPPPQAPQQPPMPGFPPCALTNPPHPFSHYAPPPGITYPAPPILATPPQGPSAQQDAWERMSVLFNTIRGHARTYEYPGASVAALESVLLRLYIESPVNVVGGGVGLAPGIHTPCQMQQHQAQQPHGPEPHSQAPMSGSSSTAAEQGNEIDNNMESG